MKSPRETIAATERGWRRGPVPSTGYGVTGLSFGCGEVLSFARISSRDGVVSWLWHRDPDGRWATHRATGGGRHGEESGIRLHWTSPELLGVSVPEHRIHWTLRLSSTPRTRALTLLGLVLPRPLRLATGSTPFVSGLLESAGTIAIPSGRLGGPSTQAIEPRRVWSVEASVAVIEGRELGPVRMHSRSGAPRPPSSFAADRERPDAPDPPLPLFVVGRARPAPASPAVPALEEARSSG